MSTSQPPSDLPPLAPPSLEAGDLPRLALVAQLAALITLADEAVSSSQAHREAAHLVCRAGREDRVAAAGLYDQDAEQLAARGLQHQSRWCRAVAAFLRGLDREATQ